MATISKEIADKIIAGEYQDDPTPLKIVEYTNAWGAKAYGVVYPRDNPDRYCATKFVINPQIYWEP